MSTIFVFSDVICPWCYLGKRRLERALDAKGLRNSVAVQWLPFELNPEMPDGGMPRFEYRARKFGAARAAELDARMRALGREEGVTFVFDKMDRTPNTRRAHMLITHASQRGRGDAVADALFRGYFEEGRDVGRTDVLLELGAASDLSEPNVKDAIDNPDLRAQVVYMEGRAAEMGISGVPFFLLEDGRSISGAQTCEAWEQLFGSLPSTALSKVST